MLEITPIKLFCNVFFQVPLPESLAFSPKNSVISVAGGGGGGAAAPLAPRLVRLCQLMRSQDAFLRMQYRSVVDKLKIEPAMILFVPSFKMTDQKDDFIEKESCFLQVAKGYPVVKM